MHASMFAEFRDMPEAGGGRLFERDGVLASILPAVPDRSLPNSVLYRDQDALADALDELTAVYEEAGVRAWTVWLPAGHARARALLEERGHVLDANPKAMAARLSDVEPPRPSDPVPDPHPRLEELGRINAVAYGAEALARVIGEGELDPDRLYLARERGEVVAGLITGDHDGDCSVWWVATLPEARGRGLASGLMRRALADARERGCDISTLQATKMGEPIYRALGYRPLGPFEMWELRRP
jgi:ribosomal protein S18 acetylase RimI-like enzyme